MSVKTTFTRCQKIWGAKMFNKWMGLILAAIVVLGLAGCGTEAVLVKELTEKDVSPEIEENDERPTPDLVGQSFAEVQKMDEYKDFTFTEKNEYSTEYPAGTIISQIPQPGQPLEGKKEIVVVVSLGAKSNVIEDYSNRHIDTVTAELEQAGIKYVVSQVYSDTIDPGYVIQTSPAAGQDMTPETVITVFYSNGPKPQEVQVSKYIGRLEAEAKIQIEGDGLTIGQVLREESMEHPAGYVIRQSLTEGTKVASGTPIDIVISSGIQ